jgi:hypothetical protein
MKENLKKMMLMKTMRKKEKGKLKKIQNDLFYYKLIGNIVKLFSDGN